jgi:hypothetical protein
MIGADVESADVVAHDDNDVRLPIIEFSSLHGLILISLKRGTLATLNPLL